MRHLFLTESDFAAVSNAYCMALRAAGEEGRCFVARHHIFGYPEQGEVMGADWQEKVESGIAWADWVWILNDLPTRMGGTWGPRPSPQRDAWIALMAKKNIALIHGGAPFRDHQSFYKKLWGEIPKLVLTGPDTMGWFQNEHFVGQPVNLKWFEHAARIAGPLRVGHYPARPTDKGSEWIVPALCLVDGIEFRTSVTNPWSPIGAELVQWREQLKRMAACDVVVDQIKSELNGQTFGEFGALAIETAALGRVSIANSHQPGHYRRTWGRDPEIRICNSEPELIMEVERLQALAPKQLEDEQRAARAWVEQCHALKPTGEKLKALCAAI